MKNTNAYRRGLFSTKSSDRSGKEMRNGRKPMELINKQDEEKDRTLNGEQNRKTSDPVFRPGQKICLVGDVCRENKA